MVVGRKGDRQIGLLQCRSSIRCGVRRNPWLRSDGKRGEPVLERVARDFVRHMPEIVAFHTDTNTAPTSWRGR